MVLHIRTVPFRNDPASPDGPEPGQLIQPFFEHLPIPGLTVDVELAAPGIIRCYGHVGFQMEGENRDETVAITLSAWLDGKRIQPGSAAGQNGIRRQHYRDVPFIWAETVDAGPHQVQMRARVSDDLPVFYRPRQYTRMHVEVSEPDTKRTERLALLRVRARRLALAHRSRRLSAASAFRVLSAAGGQHTAVSLRHALAATPTGGDGPDGYTPPYAESPGRHALEMAANSARCLRM